MILDRLQEDLEKLIHPFIEEERLVLVELKIFRRGGNVAVEILIDKPAGGISIGECSSLNRRINDAIEAQGMISDNYTIEVSSPGLDRPLRTSGDFQRVLGRPVRIFLSRPVLERVEYEGVIVNIAMNNLIVDLGQSRVEIPIESIDRGKQIEKMKGQ